MAKIDVATAHTMWTPRIFESAPCKRTFFEIPNPICFGNLAATLFDAICACAVHQHFSTSTLKDEVKATWEETL